MEEAELGGVSCESAVCFLEEAGQRIGSGLWEFFSKAAEKYALAAQNLKAVSGLYPFSG